MKILICDDDRHINNLLKYGLGISGGDTFDIITCKNGTDAVNKAIQGDFDIILMDVRMPKMDGIKAAKRIREFSEVPIVFLSAWSDKKTREKAMAAGGTKFLVKPVDYQELAILFKKLVKPRVTQSPLIEKYRRLGKLKEQAARMGNDTPPHILTEIEDLQEELRDEP